jgi:hypothetical protein
MVGESGFPLQMAVAELIRKKSDRWEVRTEEFTWAHRTGAMGHLDILLRLKVSQRANLVVEVKRPRKNVDWVFLVPSGASPAEYRTRLLWQRKKAPDAGEARPELDPWWCQAHIQPPSYVARWCQLRDDQQTRGHGQLERIGEELSHAAEAIGQYYFQESLKGVGALWSNSWILSCVVITSARLFVAKLPLDRVSLSSGVPEEPVLEPVPFVRFTKSFTPPTVEWHPTEDEPVQDFNQLAVDNERTLFVVRAENCLDFLENWDEATAYTQPWRPY